jgi:CMP-N-acetylneuraminic acid synthetase
MLISKKLIAIIPVRKNSKGIINKNLFKIGKYSLLERTILIAKNSKFIDKVYVSTDCKKMFAISKKYGVNLKKLRSKKLSTTKALTIDVIKNVITEKNIKDSYILLLQVTSPFRTLNMTNIFLKKFEKNNDANSSVSLTRFFHPHPEKIQVIKKNFVKSYLNKESMRPRQFLPKVYCLNGLFYVAKSEQLIKKNSFFTNKTSAFIVEPEKSLNLDLPDDLIILKDKIKKKYINQDFLK